MVLTNQNYKKGLLVDHELMAGITNHPEKKDHFVAFIIDYLQGEYLAYQIYDDLSKALTDVNAVERCWNFEQFGSGCKGKCKSGCQGGSCSNKASAMISNCGSKSC